VLDLFSAKPLVLTGRYDRPAKGTVTLRGKVAGHPVTRQIPVDFPAQQPQHDVLATLWARTKVDDLMHGGSAETQAEITQLGLDYKLMTPFTSFVAVEEVVVTHGGQPRRVDVPVEMPEGVSYEGVFGESPQPLAMARAFRAPAAFGSVKAGGFARPMAPPASQVRTLAVEQATPRTADLAVKLDPRLAASAQSGKVEISVFLNDSSATALAELKKLGFEVMFQPKIAKIVIGRIDASKLKALSELTVVRFVGRFG
jgi:Ca-activated chloride channel family protein